jgi:hypothetical protein
MKLFCKKYRFPQGEKMLNVDEQRIKMLSTNLSVYETEAIQCQLTFQNETTILDVKLINRYCN